MKMCDSMKIKVIFSMCTKTMCAHVERLSCNTFTYTHNVTQNVTAKF